jgi:succinoglycan biosynthesis transport protein ExoP
MALGATTIRRGRHDRTALTNFIQWMTFGLARPGRQLEHWHEVSYAPFSPFSEALGHVKLRITMNRRSKPIKTIGVTSALAGEGKSTVASNLAALYSLQGFRTLLVDVDTRNSVLSNALAPKSDYGLIDALWKEARLSDCLAPSDRGSLMMLPVGARSRAANSPELFGSERMHEVIKELSDAFDVVVFDMPPMELVKDGLALSPLLDGILVVAEWAVTPLPVLADTVDALREARAHVLGIVCTKVHERFSFRYNRQTRPYLVEMKSPSNARASSRAS